MRKEEHGVGKRGSQNCDQLLGPRKRSAPFPKGALSGLPAAAAFYCGRRWESGHSVAGN